MRTVIIGNSGSGKTWLASRLGEMRVLKPICLDDIHWEPGGFDVKRAELGVDSMIQSHLTLSQWIVEGVYGDLVERFLPWANELVWLNTPWTICHARLCARGSESKRHMGREQTSLGLSKLICWAEAYYTRRGCCSEPGHHLLFSEFAGVKQRLSSEQEVVGYLKNAA